MKRLLIALTMILALMLLALAWGTGRQTWKGYQKAYLAAGAQRVGSGEGSSWYVEQRLVVHEIRVKPLDRVDRCVSCHLGVEDPNFVGAPQPFGTHPPILKRHPPEAFGCTVCHNGQGRALSVMEAHGESAEAPARLWRGAYLQAACFHCHGAEGLPPEATAVVLWGMEQINQWNCLRCHQIDGQGESEGPELSNLANRRDWVEIYAHLLNPQAMSPGSTMPDFPLTRSQAEAITTYLLTLHGPEGGVNDARYLPGPPSTAQDQGAVKVGAESRTSEGFGPASGGAALEVPSLRYGGRAAFLGLGCSLCHRIGSSGGEVGPALTRVGRARSAEWLRRLLRDPAEVFPQGTMPQLYLSELQSEALVAYLVTLR